MSLFAPACPEQAYFKAGMFGLAGSGKTFTALLWAEGLAKRDGKKIAYVDTEHGTDFYAKRVPERQVHPEAFAFDAVYTKSLARTTEAVREAVASGLYSSIILDSMTHLWEAAIEAYEGKKTKIGSIPMPAWGPIKRPYKELMRMLIDAHLHFFLLGRERMTFEEDSDGELHSAGVSMRAEKETPHDPHITVRMRSVPDPKDSARSLHLAVFTKDRTGILDGRTIANPTYETIAPIVSILGTTQAQSEDPEEVAAADSELIAKQGDRAKVKEEKSKAFLAEFTGKITAAIDAAGLSVVRDEIKKARRYLMEEDLGAIGVLYNARRDLIVKATMPAEVW